VVTLTWLLLASHNRSTCGHRHGEYSLHEGKRVNLYEYPVATWTSVRPGSNGYRFVHSWFPESFQPWAALTIVHGFGDHGGRFAGLGNSLASMGIALLAIDLIGHGRSSGTRGRIDSYEQLLDEVSSGLELTRSEWGRIPQFLFGQSMGGNLVLNLALRRPEECRSLLGVIAASPMLRPAKMPSEQFMTVGRWLAKRFPRVRINAPVRTRDLSQDRRAQDAYYRDKHVHNRMCLKMAVSLIDSGDWAVKNAGLLQTMSVLMHGTEDKLVSSEASEEFVQNAHGMASLQLWTGCRHDLHDDLRREAYFRELSKWMKQRCMTTFKFMMHRDAGPTIAAAA
jgi:acylglycerol lipase